MHTPSPWQVSTIAGFNGPSLFATVDGKNIRLANFAEATDEDTSLLAAAPELLAACKAALSVLTEHGGNLTLGFHALNWNNADVDPDGVLGIGDVLRVAITRAEGNN